MILGKLSNIIKSRVIARPEGSVGSVSPTKSVLSLSGDKSKGILKKTQSVVNTDKLKEAFHITPQVSSY